MKTSLRLLSFQSAVIEDAGVVGYDAGSLGEGFPTFANNVLPGSLEP
jgi:hypothetical protein